MLTQTDSPAWVCCVHAPSVCVDGATKKRGLHSWERPWGSYPVACTGGHLGLRGERRSDHLAAVELPGTALHQLTESVLWCRLSYCPALVCGRSNKNRGAPQLGAPWGATHPLARGPHSWGPLASRAAAVDVWSSLALAVAPTHGVYVADRCGLPYCPAPVCGRSSKKKGGPPVGSPRWLAPEATWASGAKGGATAWPR